MAGESFGSLGTAFVDLLLRDNEYTQGLKHAEKAATSTADVITNTFRKVAGILGIAFSTYQIINYAKEATMLTARLETMAIVVGIIGKNMGYSTGQMKDYVTQVKAMGITTQAAQDSLTKMAQANLDLGKASQLARIAQDAAVIANTDSSAAFERLVWGIKSGQTEILRTMGLNVNFEASYAKLAATLHKTTGSLNEVEKTEARMLAVMAEGIKIQGAYEAAMQTTGKLINSLPRFFEEVKEKVGELFSPALGVAVRALIEGLHDMGKALDVVIKSGDMAVWAKNFADGLRVTINGIREFVSWITIAAKAVWDFKEVIVALGVGIASVAIGSWLLAVATGSGALGMALTALRMGISLTTIATVAWGTALIGVQVALAAINWPLVAVLATVTAITLAWLKWDEIMGRAPKKIYDSEDAIIRFNDKLMRMGSIKPVDPDKTKQLAKEMQDFAVGAGTTIDKITEKEKKLIKTRVEGYYEAAREEEKIRKRLSVLATEKPSDSKKVEEGTLKYFLARLEYAKQLGIDEEKEGKAQRERNAKALEDQEKLTGAVKIKAQQFAAEIADMKRGQSSYADSVKNAFAVQEAELKSQGEKEIVIAAKKRDMLISLAETTAANELKIMNKTADERASKEKFGFEKDVFLKDEKAKINSTKEKEINTATTAFTVARINEEEREFNRQLDLTRQAAGERASTLKEAKSSTASYYMSIDEYSKESYDAQKKQWEDEGWRIVEITNNKITKAMYVAQKEKEYTQSVAAYKKQIAESEIQQQLNLLDTAEIEGTFHRDTLNQRLILSKQLLDINQNLLDSIDKYTTTGLVKWNSQKEAVDKLTESYKKQLREVKSLTVVGAISEKLRTLAESWTDTATQLANVTEKAVSGMADTLTEFCMTGKLDFKSLADSIIRDLIRITIQQSMMSAYSEAGGIGGILSKLFGGGTTGFSSTTQSTTTSGMYTPSTTTVGMVGHTGGVVGQGNFIQRSVPSDVFTSAPRLHRGLAADEMPAILQKGETITPKGQANKTPDVKIIVNNRSGQQVAVSKKDVSFNMQEMVVQLWIDAAANNRYGLGTALGRV